MKKVLKYLAATLAVFIGIYLAVWAGLEHQNHKWVYSQDFKIAALQYIFNVSWALFWSTSPAWLMGLIILFTKILNKENK